MRRILRKIAEGEADKLGDTSTLADPSIVEVRVSSKLVFRPTSWLSNKKMMRRLICERACLNSVVCVNLWNREYWSTVVFAELPTGVRFIADRD